MARRDRREARGVSGEGGRKRRNRAPAFLQSDSESDGDARLFERVRRRRQYDEVQEGADDDLWQAVSRGPSLFVSVVGTCRFGVDRPS